jgi:hypothetical protein
MWIAIASVTAVINLVIAELAGWLPWLAERLIRQAARLLPPDAQNRYADEWLAELDVLPGRGISALLFSFRLLVRARRVGRELTESQDSRRWSGVVVSNLALPTTDFLLLWIGLIVALGGVPGASNGSSARALLLLLPPLVTVLLYSRAAIAPD